MLDVKKIYSPDGIIKQYVLILDIVQITLNSFY